MCQKLRKCGKCLENVQNWESMWKCVKSRENVPKVEEVCQKLRKCDKIWESEPKVEKDCQKLRVWESVPKDEMSMINCAKS